MPESPVPAGEEGQTVQAGRLRPRSESGRAGEPEERKEVWAEGQKGSKVHCICLALTLRIKILFSFFFLANG